MESVADLAPEGGVTLANAQEQWPDIEPNMTLTQLYNIINHKEDQDEQEGGVHTGNDSGLSELQLMESNTKHPVSRHKTPEMAAWIRKHLKKCTPIKAEKAHYKLKSMATET